jgi:hypothetical protein
MVKLKHNGLKQLLSASLVGALALIASVGSVQAVLLPPSPTVSPAQPLTGTGTENAGTIIGTLITPFANAAFTGNIESVVVRRTSDSGLDFYYQLRLGPTATDIRSFTLSPFDPFNVDAFYDSSSPNITSGPLAGRPNGTQFPVEVARTIAGVQFDFKTAAIDNSLVTARPNSTWVVLRTNATLFGNGNAALLDSISDNARILAPIPEPTTLLFGLGLVGAAGLSRIRKGRAEDAQILTA